MAEEIKKNEEQKKPMGSGIRVSEGVKGSFVTHPNSDTGGGEENGKKIEK